jgi:O-methyltransferase
MFYGDFSGEKAVKFREAISVMRTIFDRVQAGDNLITFSRSAGFFEDTAFRAAMERHALNDQEKSLGWRVHTLLWAAQQALHVEGDFVECGVWKGFCFGVVTHYLNWPAIPKNLYLYDTFSGIPESYNSENRSNAVYNQQNAEDPDAIFKAAQARFEGMENVHLVRGTVPETFVQACPEKIALLHLDMNSAASEIAALDVLWDRVVSGGIIVFDDYGWAAYSAQKQAEDAFMAERGHTILELPTGQGLLVKH